MPYHLGGAARTVGVSAPRAASVEGIIMESPLSFAAGLGHAVQEGLCKLPRCPKGPRLVARTERRQTAK